MMRFRTQYAKIWHTLTYWIFQSEGTWETVRKDFVTFYQNWLQNLHMNVPSYTWMKGAPLSAKTEGHWEESEWTGLAVFPSLPHLAHTLFGPNTFFHNSLLFIKPSKKKKKKKNQQQLRFNHSFTSSFPYENSHA